MCITCTCDKGISKNQRIFKFFVHVYDCHVCTIEMSKSKNMVHK